MATGLPAGQKLEIEFVAGTWTDVTSYVEFDQTVTIQRTRTSQLAPLADPATFTVSLDNSDGRFTPNKQVLVDSTGANTTTANPYWPNVQMRKRIRFSSTPTGYRFLGYITNWLADIENGVRSRMKVTARDRLYLLNRPVMKAPMVQEAIMDTPGSLYPLGESAGSLTATDLQGKSPQLTVRGTGPAPTFGVTGPGTADGTAVQFSPISTSNGQYLQTSLDNSLGIHGLEAWFSASGVPSSPAGCVVSIELSDPSFSTTYIVMQLTTSGFAQLIVAGTTMATGAVNLCDGKWHHLFMANTGSPFTTAWALYVDGVSIGSGGPLGPLVASNRTLRVGQTAIGAGLSSALFTGSVGHVAVYTTAPSAGRIAAHYTSATGYSGDTTGARIARYLGFAGLTSSDWSLATGGATVGTYPQAGVNVLQACQDMVTTEGGGAVLFADGSGVVTFLDRNARKPGSPALTLDAAQDLMPTPFAPTLDDQVLANSSTVTRANVTGTLSTQVWTNAASISANGTVSADFTSYNTSDVDALDTAQYIIATQVSPGYRLAQATVDLATAQNNLYAALSSTTFCSRVRVTSIAPAYSPATQLDFIVEGITETISPDEWLAQFDLSTADNPPWMIWGGSSDYSRWQASSATLNATITAAATNLAIATASGPTFTTVSARYPMNILLDGEIITLQTAPSGSTSPQSFTGVLRGQLGTAAAAHTSAAVINLYPAVTWAL